MSDAVFVEVEGIRISEWTRYSIDSDLLTPADGFSLELEVPGNPRTRQHLLALLVPGAEVRIYVGDDVADGSPSRDRYIQMHGVIDERRILADRDEGTVIQLQGRDLAGYLTQSSVALDLDVRSNMRLVDLVRAAVEPYDITVVTDSFAGTRRLAAGDQAEAARRAGVPPSHYSLTAQEEASRTGRPIDEATDSFLSDALSAIQARRAARSGYANAMGPGDIERLTVRDARPKVGETVWGFCERHAQRLGVMMWMSPLGRLVLSSPRYTQEPRYRATRRYTNDPAEPNNVRDGTLLESIGDRHSEVVVYGRGDVRSSERRPVTGTATDDSWPSRRIKPLYLQETSIRTGAEAARKALRELMRFKKDAFQLDYQLDDHGQNGYLYAVDTTIAVVDEPLEVEGTFYVVKRTFTKDRIGGTSTSIRAVPRGSLVF